MINKIYVKVTEYIKEEYKFLIVLGLILFLGLFHLPYNLYTGGGIIDLDKRLEVEGEKKINGSYNLAYVKSIRSTIPTYLMSYIFDWERESVDDIKIDENDNVKDMWEREKLYLQEANDNAIISAFKESNEQITINKELLKVLYIDNDSDTDLEIGDTILKINDIELKEFSDIKDIIKDFNVGDKIKVNYLRDDKEKSGYFILREIEKEKKAGLYLIKLFDYDTEKEVKLKFRNSEGGPSGGFMTSLAIYTKLTGKDLLKGKRIVGTGTIDANGNIGEIGGVKYKLMGAEDNDADIFFVPEANYEEAIKVKNDKKYKIDVVKVKTLHDAIEYLESR